MRAEEAAPSTRVFALVTGAAGLLAVGALVIAMTPPRADSPIAVSATTTLAAGDTTPLGITRAEPTPPLATPVGNGQLALITAVAARHQTGDTIEVRFATGGGTTGRVLHLGDHAAIVELAGVTRGDTPSYVTHADAADDEIVTVLSDPPITVELSSVGDTQADEGTAVVDGHGALVGLCTKNRDGTVRVVDVSDELAAATSAGP